uniref:Ubiquinol-cytochrome c chaperone domain-containing protein n=1 Tax=Spongospora subterranea TaxID=70186 RepID=A0A0H5RM09_9EUKA|eukprot:CRZ09769.1 hypothetical protein [Spongospora subterranea]
MNRISQAVSIRFSSRRIGLRVTRSASTSVQPSNSGAAVFEKTLQNSPFIGHRVSGQPQPKSSPWLANILKSLFLTQCERNVNSAVLYEICAKQALNPKFYRDSNQSLSGFKFENTFANHLELTAMHVWMCKTRIMQPSSIGDGSAFDQAEARLFLEQFLERMWEHVARSLTGAGAPDIRLNKFLKEIQDSAFGSFIAYDQALYKFSTTNDPSSSRSFFDNTEAAVDALTYATTSNLFGPVDGEYANAHRHSAIGLSRYMVQQLVMLDSISDADLRSTGYAIRWIDPTENLFKPPERKDALSATANQAPI